MILPTSVLYALLAHHIPVVSFWTSTTLRNMGLHYTKSAGLTVEQINNNKLQIKTGKVGVSNYVLHSVFPW